MLGEGFANRPSTRWLVAGGLAALLLLAAVLVVSLRGSVSGHASRDLGGHQFGTVSGHCCRPIRGSVWRSWMPLRPQFGPRSTPIQTVGLPTIV